MSDWWLLLVAVLLIVANAFFVAVEFSLLAASRPKVEEWAEEGRSGAASALAGMQSLNLQLAACQLGITVMSLMLGWLIEPVIGGALEELLGRTSLPHGVSTAIGVALALTFVSFVHMVAGEMVPKSLALAAPESTLVLLAPAHRAATAVLKPVVVGLNALGILGTRMLKVEPAEELGQAHTPEELAAMLDASVAGGEIDAGDYGLLSGALDFLRVRVAEVMSPARELVTVPSTATLAEAEQLMVDSGHSRVLVTDGSRVNGFLHAKDLLNLDGLPGELLPDGLVRLGLWVGPDESISEVLFRMRRARRHVAVVSSGGGDGDGDDGPILGLVTMEDLLEAIVGDIRDESDRDNGAGGGQAGPGGHRG
ncbi:MAG: HlyC/CorC family transporter [Actinomycetia bacterium]|nr:HlyC/CorC family transporter [Actinomycetes bacterium]